MAIKILISGLSGAGKSYLSEILQKRLNLLGTCQWLNADKVRSEYNDWDFSVEGRQRQGQRLKELADSSKADWVILDFIAPLEETRTLVDADWTIWLDTVSSSKYKDTDFVFQPPEKYDFHVVNRQSKDWADEIFKSITSGKREKVFDSTKPTVQLLGRFQPWHEGHKALFCKALEKTGQVAVMVRDCYDPYKNPFTFEEVKTCILRSLDEEYQGMFDVVKVPNIVNITYGRDVGYTIEREFLDADLEAISATSIRKNLLIYRGKNV